MDIEKLIEDLHGILKQYGEKIPYGELVGAPWPYSRVGDLVWQDPEPYFIEQAATSLSTLQAENEKLRADLENERAHRIHAEQHADAFQKDCERLNAQLERVTAERDAAVSDVSAILAEVEEIRRGYGVDNADADNAFTNLCGNYCAKRGNNCYEEAKNYRCKNFKWRGQKED